MKRCTKCDKEKEISQFNLCKGKPRAYCKACHSASAMAWSNANIERRREIANAFTKRKRERLGPPKNGGRPPIYTPEQKALKKLEWNRKWQRENKTTVLAKTREYQAIKINAFPVWADRQKIKDLYIRAAHLSKVTGVPMEVDHIYPLQGREVCGLHVEHNLRIISRFENRSKNNRMPENVA